MKQNQLGTGMIHLTGISASGKTTLGKGLYASLKEAGFDNIKLLDGEDLRARLGERGDRIGYSRYERVRYSFKIMELVGEYNRNGYLCIVCAIIHVKTVRQRIRERIGNYMEVFLDCPVDVCAARDKKDNYRKAYERKYDDFVGVTEPYQRTQHPELILNTDKMGTDECLRLLRESIFERFTVRQSAEDSLIKN